MPTTPCLSQKPENCCCYGRVSTLWTLKTPVFMARKRWRHDVTMCSENSQGYLWIPCEFYSSLANQIMCNKQSALELIFTLFVISNYSKYTNWKIYLHTCKSWRKAFKIAKILLSENRIHLSWVKGLLLCHLQIMAMYFWLLERLNDSHTVLRVCI